MNREKTSMKFQLFLPTIYSTLEINCYAQNDTNNADNYLNIRYIGKTLSPMILIGGSR